MHSGLAISVLPLQKTSAWEPPNLSGSLFPNPEDFPARSLHFELVDELGGYGFRQHLVSDVEVLGRHHG